jgi:hypothetical protein
MKIEIKRVSDIPGEKFKRRGRWDELIDALKALPSEGALRVEFDSLDDLNRAKSALYQRQADAGLNISMRKDPSDKMVMWFIPEHNEPSH